METKVTAHFPTATLKRSHVLKRDNEVPNKVKHITSSKTESAVLILIHREPLKKYVCSNGE